MKKTWIKIKRGLLEPKHRNILGIRVWLYIYMLDKADWDTGTIYEWRDKDEAADLQMPWRTLQQQRQQLAEFGYITCVQRKDHQDIIIHNWTNPREYTGEIYNPTKEQDTENPVPPEMGEGTYEGTNKGSRKPSTLPIGSHITDHSRDEKLAIRKQLEIYFKSTTKLPAPNGNIKEHQKLWWTPLEEIAGLANWNYG